MIKLIEEIIQRFGPRVAGTKAEHDAQKFIQEKCASFTEDTRFLPFESHLDARFGKLKIFVALYFLSLLLFWWSPLLSFIISFINVFFLVVEFLMYRVILPSFPGKKQTSWNVEATLEPLNEVKSTLIISAHMDSTLEYTWWYKFGVFGKQLTIYAGLLMLLQFIFNLSNFWVPFEIAKSIWFIFLFLSPLTMVYWSMHGKKGVPGAHDNLSGITIAYHLLEHFSNPEKKGYSTFLNTRLRFISFGSEEKGLLGARAYLKENYDRILEENTFIVNFDSIRLVDEVAVVTSEAAGTKHHPLLIQEMMESFQRQNIPCKFTKVPIGGMDSTPFARKGIPTVSLLGITSKDIYYHTRNDTVENLEEEALENVFKGVQDFLQKWDNK